MSAQYVIGFSNVDDRSPFGITVREGLETAWEELEPAVQEKLLWGTGDQHITFTWRSGPHGIS